MKVHGGCCISIFHREIDVGLNINIPEIGLNVLQRNFCSPVLDIITVIDTAY